MRHKFWHDWLIEHVFTAEIVMIVNPEAETETIVNSLIAALMTIPMHQRGNHFCQLLSMLKTGQLDGCIRHICRCKA